MISDIHQHLSEFVVSPLHSSQCSGTVILFFDKKQPQVLTALSKANISVDERKCGVRVSPHIYTTKEDINALIKIIKQALKEFD